MSAKPQAGTPICGFALEFVTTFYKGLPMSARQKWMTSIALLIFLLATSDVYAQGKKQNVKLNQQWSGSVEDEALQKTAPEVITDAKEFASLWKSWKIEGKAPEIDFAKEIVIATTSRGSKLNLSARLDDNGNLEILGFGTRDLRSGFRYVLGTVSREGIKSVNKKALPK
jgi:hypothetical protein